MIYRCRVCHHEDSRGWLPTATSGLYAMVLLIMTASCLASVLSVIRLRLSERPLAVEPVATQWWHMVLAGILTILTLIIMAVSVAAMNFALQLVEWMAYARRRCPACGACQWSWGFTRGFGL